MNNTQEIIIWQSKRWAWLTCLYSTSDQVADLISPKVIHVSNEELDKIKKGNIDTVNMILKKLYNNK